MTHACRFLTGTFALYLGLACVTQRARAEEDLGPPFGLLTLVDEVNTANVSDPHPLFEDPAGGSSVATVLGKRARVLPMGDDAQVIAYKLGAGKNLVPGNPYVLVVEYPEDTSRQFVLVNRGAAMTRTYSTGQTIGDARHAYTYPSPESLKYPLSGRWESVRTLFWLGEKGEGVKGVRDGKEAVVSDTKTDGFWVVIGRFRKQDSPLDAGAAVARIRLFSVPASAQLDLPIHFPPADLPRRHVFWREEMGDAPFTSEQPAQRLFRDSLAYFDSKMKQAKFLGINTFSRHLLVFGYTQQWDNTSGGGNAWFYTSKQADLWGRIVGAATAHGLDIMPYYEYAGALGGGTNGVASLGAQRRCRPLGDRANNWFSNVSWSENACVDVSDPEFLTDVDKLLDATVTPFAGTAKFAGAWFRTRNSNWPVSFADATLGRFGVQKNGGVTPTRAQLQSNAALLQKYYAWWFEKRRDFLIHVRDHLKAKTSPDAVVLFTSYIEEALRIPAGGEYVTPTDDVPTLTTVNGAAPWQYQFSPSAWAPYVAAGKFLTNITSMNPPSAAALAAHAAEDDHSAPPADPSTYAGVDDVYMTMPFSRLFTTSDRKPFDAFRTRSGLAIARHFNLNEEDGQNAGPSAGPMSKRLGYFVSDVDRTGAHSMLAEARALAYGDPRYIGYLSSSNFGRGFPEATRAFNAAFLALPALPSTVVQGASADAEVVVREIKTATHGTYYAIVNTGMTAKASATIVLPATGAAYDLVADKDLVLSPNGLTLSLSPGAVVAVVVAGDPSATGGGQDGGAIGASDGGLAAGPDDGAAGAGDRIVRDGGCSMSGAAPASMRLLLAVVCVGLCLRRRRSRSVAP